MVSIPTGRDQTLQDGLLSCPGREINFYGTDASKLTSTLPGPAISPLNPRNPQQQSNTG